MAGAGLEAFIDETIRVSAEHGYRPRRFMEMRDRYGTIESISRLVRNGDVQSGFSKLNKLGLIDYSIEAAILKFPDEFSRQDRECAEFRLRRVNSS